MKLVLLLAITLTSRFAFAYQEIGNGGGGILENGNVLTFYSARIPVIPKPLEVSEIPGAAYLLQQLSTLAVSPALQKEVFEKVYPTLRRTYYRLDESKVNSEQMQAIVHEYAQLSGVPENSLVLLAATNSELNATALFPSFFKLQKDSERAALLLHEASWLSGVGTYRDIVHLEVVAQQYFETHGGNDDNYFEFYRLLDFHFSSRSPTPNAFLLQASLQHDRQRGLLGSPGLPAGKMYIRDLFTKEYLECKNLHWDLPQNCEAALAIQLSMQAARNPNHLLWRALTLIMMSDQTAFMIEGTTNYTGSPFEKMKDLSNIVIDFTQPLPDEAVSFPLSLKGKVIGRLSFY